MFKPCNIIYTNKYVHDSKEVVENLKYPAYTQEQLDLWLPIIETSYGQHGAVTVVEDIDPAKARKVVYESEATIAWDEGFITVDEANRLFLNYLAESNTVKVDSLKKLIADAKAAIRMKYPVAQ